MAKVKPGDAIFQDFRYSQRPVNITPQDVERIQSSQAVQNCLDEIADVAKYGEEERYGFDKSMLAVLNAPKDDAIRADVKKLAKKLEEDLKGPVKYVVHCGIGGSELGATMMVTACGDGETKYYPITSLNHDSITRIMREIDPKQTVLIKATRSNTTLETLAAFDLFEQFMERSLGSDYKKQCVAIVDKKLEGQDSIAGYHFLPIEGNMSGRFTCAHAANLLTMYLNGVDVDAFHDGARHMLARCISGRTVEENPALEVAVYSYMMNREKDLLVFNAGIFSPDLTKYGDWLGQLVEESLVHRGDIALVTKTSELSNKAHSFFQGWIQGKSITYHQFVVPANNIEGGELALKKVKGYEGRTAQQIEFAAYLGIAESLANAGRPSYTTMLERVDERTLGQLVMRDMISTMIMGELLGLRKEYENSKVINPGYLHQPGVENYKVLMRGQLAQPEKLQETIKGCVNMFVH